LNGGVISTEPAWTTTRVFRSRRIRRGRLAVLAVVIAAIAVVLGSQLTESMSSTALTPEDFPRHQLRAALGEQPGPPGGHPLLGERGPLGEADGAVPDGTTVFDDGVPGVANLDPDLLAALREAATAAAGDGVEFLVDSGWRSAAYQEHLLQEAIAKYGSEAEAARWVATPQTSPHVSGDAVDIGPPDAAAWLSAHGAEYGLCQIYANEPWHYELRPEAVDNGCPSMYADPTHDPRMER
jgi:D-alanyl-D-alanine carboxypeptidase